MKWIAKIYEVLSNAWYRLRLRNDNFTIITNTCIGGVMYHKLGKQFLSPTINLWMYDVEFYRFINNLKEYMQKELVFVDGIDETPTAWCGDVMIHFNHAHSNEEAARDWYKRRERINYDNLFIICSDKPFEDQSVSYEDIASLKNISCRGKVVFSTRHYDDIDYIVPLPKADDGDWVNVYMLDKNKNGRWRWESAFDWVHWLNAGDVRLKE